MLALWVVTACSEGDEAELGVAEATLSTVSFQTGASGYAGTIDGEISSQGGGNGSRDFSSSTALINRRARNETEALIRFANLSLPPGAVVTSATLALRFRDVDRGSVLRGYYVTAAWDRQYVGWVNRGRALPWNTPGAKGVGTDIASGPAFTDAAWTGADDITKTYALDPARVQAWIDNPSTDLGVVLRNSDVINRDLSVYTSRASAMRRPKLTISFTIPAPSGSDAGVDAVTPSDAAIDAGTASDAGTDSGGGGGTASSHPRIWMDAARLQTLRQTATANDPRWIALREQCNGYLGGVVTPPDPTMCQDSCRGSTICCGYQGDGYYAALLTVGLCYQIGKGLSPPDPNTAAWAQKGADVLAQMTAFTNYTADHGYGIRFFATGMSVGYDWLYDFLAATNPALAAGAVARLDAWIDWYDAQPGFFNFRDHPTSNYFAGYYAAKALVALATDGDNPNASSYWTGFLGLQRTAVGSHAGIAAYFTKFLDGGGWVQGWQYGPLAVRNMIEPSLAAMTARGIDLVTDAGAPYHYAVNNALHLLHFSTPSLAMMDDRDELSGFNPADPGVCPSMAKTPVSLALTLTEMLRRWPAQAPGGDPVAPRFHSFARAVRRIYAAQPWQDMLFWDDAAAETPYTSTPDRSYLATNYVAMRSDWSTSATMATLRAIAYSDKDNTHEHPDGGSLIITRGNGGAVGDWNTDVPFLVGPNYLLRCYGTMPFDSSWENYLRTDLLTSTGARSTLNGFRNSTTSGQSIVIYQDDSPAPQSQIKTFEDRAGYVLARAENLGDLYPASAGITEWSRDVLFLRPNLFVVYDRTTSGGATADPNMSWHFAPTPVLVAPPSPGAVRYDVSDGMVFRGAMTTLLPTNASVTLENTYQSNKLYGIQVRGASSGSIKWLTVLDTATSSAAVAQASAIQTLNTNGALLVRSTGPNDVVLFGTGAAGAPIPGAITYTQPAAGTTVVVVDLPPSTPYAVTASIHGGSADVTIAPGPSLFTTSARGTLYITIAADGTVTSAN